MALLEVVVKQNYANQTILNRYHYQSTGVPATSSLSFLLLKGMGYLTTELTAGAFPGGKIAGQVQGIQVSTVLTNAAFARDLYSVTDFYETAFPTPPAGTATGEGMSPVLASGFLSTRTRTDIKRGQKRFVGASESHWGPGGVLIAGEAARYANVAGSLGATLSVTDGASTVTFAPVVLGLEKYTTPSGNDAYRIRSTEAAQLLYVAPATSWAVYSGIRSQVSRQYGRGV